MKRKSEEQEKGSFLEDVINILWKILKKIGELAVKVIKKIIKEVWTNA